MMMTTFNYVTTNVKSLRAHVDEQRTKTGRLLRKTCDKIEIDGQAAHPTSRFWNSLYSMYGFNGAFFKYFSHDEVFTRLQERDDDREIRVCVESDNGVDKLLACTNPNSGLITYDELMDLTSTLGGDKVRYANGVVESCHKPAVGAGDVSIGGDQFTPHVTLSAPIDGYGLPSLYLSLLRQVCSNGLVAMDKAFQSRISVGKKDGNVSYSIARHLQGYGNDEGYSAIRQRISSSQTSRASLFEVTDLYNAISRVKENISSVAPEDTAGSMVQQEYGMSNRFSVSRSLVNLAGDVSSLYGLASTSMVNTKKLKTLPAKCSVYDLINFATEVATHHSDTTAARRLHGWVGGLISNEYDLEGAKMTLDSNGFKELHLSA
jgi:hypothetical protein